MERKSVWEKYEQKDMEKLEHICQKYLHFLSNGKTERECVEQIVAQAEEAGYKSLEQIIQNRESVKSGDKIYSVCMNKAVVMFCIGKKPLEEGMNILGAHIDSPRLDVKQNPLYEDGDMAYLDTHYYGGIKK